MFKIALIIKSQIRSQWKKIESNCFFPPDESFSWIHIEHIFIKYNYVKVERSELCSQYQVQLQHILSCNAHAVRHSGSPENLFAQKCALSMFQVFLGINKQYKNRK